MLCYLRIHHHVHHRLQYAYYFPSYHRLPICSKHEKGKRNYAVRYFLEFCKRRQLKDSKFFPALLVKRSSIFLWMFLVCTKFPWRESLFMGVVGVGTLSGPNRLKPTKFQLKPTKFDYFAHKATPNKWNKATLMLTDTRPQIHL